VDSMAVLYAQRWAYQKIIHRKDKINDLGGI